MKHELVTLFQSVLSELNHSSELLRISRPENSDHGDYTTNIAFLLGKQQKVNPVTIAQQIVNFIENKKKQAQNSSDHNVLQDIEAISIAGPGFINISVDNIKIITLMERVIKDKEAYGRAQSQNKKYMVEFAHPNTHKAFHIGHLRNITTGESLVRLLEANGNTVIRANYQGDVGMHIAKCLYAMIHIPEFDPSSVRSGTIHDRVTFLGKAYAAGSKSFEENEEAKNQIGIINKQIYAKDPSIYELYKETRQWSLDYFETIYTRVGTHYDRYYFESEVYDAGKKNVEDGLEKGIFQKSEGAVIFPGEKFGFHNRVFISSEGNPTYEGKEMGLAPLQFSEHHPDLIIHVVGPEQAGYFQVCFEAMAQLFPETKGKEKHQVYGWVKLKHGKMSSRSGNVILGEWLLDEIKTSIYSILDQSTSKYTGEERESIAEACAIAAVKYSYLKVGLSQEIAFDIEESVNIHGDSGPYLLYTYARCKSVLRKATDISTTSNTSITSTTSLSMEERILSRLIMYFPEMVAEAAEASTPSSIARYLIDVSQAFNAFYAKYQILNISTTSATSTTPTTSLDAISNFRLLLTGATAQILHNGLYLLGIKTVERM